MGVSAMLPEAAKGWLDANLFAMLVTIDPDGRPRGSVVWVERDGEELLVSTMRGRRKHQNILRDPRVTVVAFPLADPYSYVEIRGDCTIENAGAVELIESLCWRYMGHEIDTDPTGRIVLRIRPEGVVLHPSRPLQAELAERSLRAGPGRETVLRQEKRPW
jgi:PPOX class probable F420-dependent enzyme